MGSDIQTPDSPAIKNSSPIIARILLGIPVALLLGALAWINHRQEQRLDELERNAVQIVGRVSGKQCQNHMQVNYFFELSGREFHGIGACVESCLGAKIGDPVEVKYSKTDPSNFDCRGFAGQRALIKQNYNVLLFLSALSLCGIVAITRIDPIKRVRNLLPY